MSGVSIRQIRDLDLAFEPWTWPFAYERRADIAAHFEARRARAGDGIWNGRVLLMHRRELVDGVLRGAYFETDFADFLAWRDWDCPDTDVTNCFAMGALRGSDGAFLLGVMGPNTANAGRAYFPGGTPDPDDIVDGRVDLASSLMREIGEETGLQPGDFSLSDAWHAVIMGPRIAMIRVLQADQSAEAVRRRVLAHLAHASHPELVDIRIVRGRSDFDDTMPMFVTAFLSETWR